MRKYLFSILLAVSVLTAFLPVAQAQSYNCYGALPARLQIGGQGRVTPGLPNTLRSQPYQGYGSVILGQIPGSETFTVVGGPHCFGSMYWWQVNYRGVIGWTPEGQGYSYWLEPISFVVSPFPNTCFPTATPHVYVGYTGIVNRGLPNRLRLQPSLNGLVAANMNAGETFTVLAGPTCADGLLWWQVNYHGMVGWTVEGQSGQFWIDPLVCPGFQPSRLATSRYARVTPGLPNRLRLGASTYSMTLALIPAGAVFSVIGGQVCGQSAAWWRVSYQGVVGWTMEGQGGSYWLELAN